MTIASIHGREAVKTAEKILILPDIALNEVVDKNAYDAILMPGGVTGSPNLVKCELVGEILKYHHSKGKLIGAICMAPTVLLANDIALGSKITSYPTTKSELSQKYEFVEEDVVQDGNIITSKGPGTVWRYTLKIAENLVGIEETKRVAKVNLLTEYLDKNIL